MPIGRAERKVIDKAADDLQDIATEHTEAAEFVLEEYRRIKQELVAERAKPEWARRAAVLEKLENEWKSIGDALDKLIEIGNTLMDTGAGLEARNEFLIKREEEEGY